MDVKYPDRHYPAMPTEIEILQSRIQERLDSLGLKPAPAAIKSGFSDSYIRDIMRKGTMPSAKNLDKVAAGLETTADYLLGKTDVVSGGAPKPRTATIVGRAGAATDGRVVFAEGQGGLGTVLLPEGATEESVAIEVEGYSMGVLADGALIFYTEVHTAPTEDMLGLVVVVGTEGGEVLLKKLLRGSRAGLYDLESINGPTKRDQKVVWAAHIDSLVPPWRARRLRVEAGEVSL